MWVIYRKFMYTLINLIFNISLYNDPGWISLQKILVENPWRFI